MTIRRADACRSFRNTADTSCFPSCGIQYTAAARFPPTITRSQDAAEIPASETIIISSCAVIPFPYSNPRFIRADPRPENTARIIPRRLFPDFCCASRIFPPAVISRIPPALKASPAARYSLCAAASISAERNSGRREPPIIEIPMEIPYSKAIPRMSTPFVKQTAEAPQSRPQIKITSASPPWAP